MTPTSSKCGELPLGVITVIFTPPPYTAAGWAGGGALLLIGSRGPTSDDMPSPDKLVEGKWVRLLEQVILAENEEISSSLPPPSPSPLPSPPPPQGLLGSEGFYLLPESRRQTLLTPNIWL